MKSKAILIIVTLSLSACSGLAGMASDAVLGAVTGKDSGLSVDTEIVAGDKKQSISDSGADTKLEDVTVRDNAQINTNTTGKATDISGAETVYLNEGVKFWQAGFFGIIMFMLALFLPQLQVKRKR